jgi:malate synthase
MTVPFMRAYTERLVAACHQRGAHAIGGMAAFIPNRRDEEVTERALAAVRADTEREAGDGFDGTWVAHPDLVPVATAVFDRALGDQPHQKHRLREDAQTAPAELRAPEVPHGMATAAGVAGNVRVALAYLDSWLQGRGAAAIDNLMEDPATAEIARAQLWQWRRHEVRLDDGHVLDDVRYRAVRDAELERLGGRDRGRLDDAATLLDELVLVAECPDFLTLKAYPLLD